MMPEFTNRDLMRCAQRECGQRRWVYKNRVAAGKMTQADADKELAMMEAIALHFGGLAEAEEKKGKLL